MTATQWILQEYHGDGSRCCRVPWNGNRCCKTHVGMETDVVESYWMETVLQDSRRDGVVGVPQG